MSETFTKAERLCSKKLIDELFGGGSASMAAFPLRAVYRFVEHDTGHCTEESVPVQVLISVPKKRLRLAVDRNRMKRQVREAYRRNKQSLCQRLSQQRRSMNLAFVCISNEASPSSRVAASVKKILRRIEESLTKE